MIKIYIIIFFGLVSFQAVCQNEVDTTEVMCWGRICELTDKQLNKCGPIKLTFAKSPDEAEEFANEDIANGTIFLLLAGGISATIITTDAAFERKYDIYFNEFGCTGPEYELITAYNSVVFEHLTQQYGKRWYKEIRKDVVGLKDWKKKD